jgi:hypothetical protein
LRHTIIHQIRRLAQEAALEASHKPSNQLRGDRPLAETEPSFTAGEHLLAEIAARTQQAQHAGAVREADLPGGHVSHSFATRLYTPVKRNWKPIAE